MPIGTRSGDGNELLCCMERSGPCRLPGERWSQPQTAYSVMNYPTITPRQRQPKRDSVLQLRAKARALARGCPRSLRVPTQRT